VPNRIATVAELYVYPVKSMAGVAVLEAHVGLDGILGDRQYAFVLADKAARDSFPWMTARQSARMLLYKPGFAEAPTPAKPEPALHVRTPDGAVLEAGDPALTEELVREMGQPLFLLRSMRGVFDCQHVSLFSLATVGGLSLQAECPIDPRQFRANVYMDPVSGRAFDEETWTDCLMQIGDEVVLAVTQRDPRCMMINLDPESGVQNPRVLRTVAQGHDGQAGLYANVVRQGTIRNGDRIVMIPKP
jgi:uncharacterized protein YcbX